MNKKFDVILVGLGPMGKIIAKLLINRKNANLKGVVDINPQLVGKNLSKILKMEPLNIIIESDLDLILSKEKVDVVIVATSSSLEKDVAIIKKAINAKSHVISICEELSYPFHYYPKLSDELDTLAKSKNVTVIGTGINPGYIMDILPIVFTAPCQKVESIKVKRMINSAKRRESFQRKIGTGLTPEKFQQKINKKEITGHVGLVQSIQMIGAALGIEYDEIVEYPPKEIITEKDLVTSYGEKVLKGYVCGLESKAIAKKGSNELVMLDFIAYNGAREEYDSIIINGIPDIHQKIIGGVHGDIGTSAMVVNLIPKVIEAKSGLLTMKDISVPCNTENIWKKEKV
ncbi:MAG: Gfo/Idh/MocA family oxidoreductase [Candidatus Hodarchaeota archaeon]